MGIDYTRLIEKLNPDPGGEDVLRLRVGTVSAISSTGSVTITLSGVPVPGVPALNGAVFAVGTAVQVLSFRGSLLILGASGGVSSQPVDLTGSSSVLGSTNSTSFTNTLTTSGIHGVAFVAPASGRVQVTGRASGRHNTINGYTHLDFEVREGSTVGSGTLFRAPNNDTASVHLSTPANAQGTLLAGSIVSGLTPGGLYNASLTYKVDSGTGEFLRRYISVYPL